MLTGIRDLCNLVAIVAIPKLVSMAAYLNCIDRSSLPTTARSSLHELYVRKSSYLSYDCMDY